MRLRFGLDDGQPRTWSNRQTIRAVPWWGSVEIGASVMQVSCGTVSRRIGCGRTPAEAGHPEPGSRNGMPAAPARRAYTA